MSRTIGSLDIREAVANDLGKEACGIDYHYCNDVLPTHAYFSGYRFLRFTVSFIRVDPYILFDPDGRPIKLWWGKPPSQTEIFELTSMKGGG